MGCLPPDLFVCVCARGVCGSVRGRERREETASCAHAATKHVNIFKLYEDRYHNKKTTTKRGAHRLLID